MQKKKYGPATLIAFRLLSRLKGLRGSALDIFGRTEERRSERALIGEYRASIDEILGELSQTDLISNTLERYQLALGIARIPEQIRGFGHVKARNLLLARQDWQTQMAQFRSFPLLQKSV